MSEVVVGDVKIALLLSARITNYEIADEEMAYMLSKLKGRMSGEQIIVALDDLTEKGKKPTLAAILEYEKGGYDSPEIAYSKAVAVLTDETQTCLMNDCIAMAWEVARPLYEEGMKYDASKAFEATYKQKVIDAKAMGESKPRWWLSMGTDKSQREEFIRESVAQGLISADAGKMHLPHLSDEEVSTPGSLLPPTNILRLEKSVEKIENKASKEEARQAITGLKNLLSWVSA